MYLDGRRTMKRTLIIMCLFFTANSWADDEEFPIELTCELGHLIVYYNITDNPETTWWQNHDSNRFDKAPQSFDYTINKDKNLASEQNKIAKLRKYTYEITDDYFFFGTKNERSYIHRKTGKVTISLLYLGKMFDPLSESVTGHCTKGFKNYEKNVF
jgi:hypothetical protein